MTLTAELRDNPTPTEQQVRDMLAGNLCRCTGYQGMVDAVLAATRTGVSSSTNGNVAGAR
jgi:carbon-monoxide dehydrogenase small subunit